MSLKVFISAFLPIALGKTFFFFFLPFLDLWFDSSVYKMKFTVNLSTQKSCSLFC